MPAWESETPISLDASSDPPWRESIPPRIAALITGLDGNGMQLYWAFYYTLAWSITISVLFPLTIPWAMLSYKIWHGNKPIDEEFREELLSRSWRAALMFVFVAVGILLLDYMTVTQLELPVGPVHLVYFLGFLGLAGWTMMFFFSMEDLLQGLILTVIYLYVPAALLGVLTFLFRNPLHDYVLSWLTIPK
jgi:hypothetical protein